MASTSLLHAPVDDSHLHLLISPRITSSIRLAAPTIRLRNILTSLALHRTHTSILKEQPIVRLIPLSCTPRVRDLVLRVVAVYKVLHDTSRFEEIDSLSIGEGIGECRDAAIRVDGEEPVFLLRVLTDFDLVGFVGEAGVGKLA